MPNILDDIDELFAEAVLSAPREARASIIIQRDFIYLSTKTLREGEHFEGATSLASGLSAGLALLFFLAKDGHENDLAKDVLGRAFELYRNLELDVLKHKLVNAHG